MQKQWLIRAKPKKLDLSDCTLADMHFHSKFSEDGLRSIPKILKRCSKLGVGVAITDHNTVKGSLAALSYKKEALVIPGVELTAKEGVHLLAYTYTKGDLMDLDRTCIQPFRKKNPMVLDVSVCDLLDRLHKLNCITGAPHPYFGLVGICTAGLKQTYVKKLDVVEVLNRYSFKKWNNKAYRWALESGKGLVGGSDGHTLFDLGKALTGVESQVGLQGFLEAIRKRKSFVVGTESGLLDKAFLTVEKEARILTRSKGFTVTKGQVRLNYAHLKSKLRTLVEQRRRKKQLFM